jgi:hypothetical protein
VAPVKTEDLQDLVRAARFRPFAIGLADGTRFRVDHPECIAFRGGRTAVVIDPDERVHLIDVMLALKLEVDPPVSAGSVAAEPDGEE